MKGRVLIIAGSDSGGGAGIQADIKTVTVLQGFAMTAITALTAQNTVGVQGIYPIPKGFVVDQMVSVITDLGVDAVKIGMIGSCDIVEAISETLARYAPDVPVIVDPAMCAKGGARLTDDQTTKALMATLVPQACIVTPNIPEAEVLAEMTIDNFTDMQSVARKIIAMGAQAVLLKGGHMKGNELIDLLCLSSGEEFTFKAHKINSVHTHGTGCTMASAIAVGIAQQKSLYESVKYAQAYVQKAIVSAPRFGAGNGPLNHAFHLDDIKIDF